MKNNQRPMKKYTPRRRRTRKDLQMQQIIDLEQLLQMDLNSYFALVKEGTQRQSQKARAKMRKDLVKYGQEMEAISRDLGEGFPELVRNFTRSYGSIVDTASANLGEELLKQHENIAEVLKKAAVSKAHPQS